MLKPLAWQLAFRLNLPGGPIANELVEVFTLPRGLLYPTFRSVVPGLLAPGPTINVSLRFGFTDADVEIAGQGVDLAAIGAGNRSDTRSPVWGGTTAAPLAHPDFTGNPQSFLPPRCGIFLNTADFTGFLEVSYCGAILS